MKVKILKDFHRFVSQGEGKPERKENFNAGQVKDDVSDEDAKVWIENGLAEEAHE